MTVSSFQLLVVIAAMGVVTAAGTLWLCFKARRVSAALTDASKVKADAAEQSHESFIEALTRIEAEVGASRIAAAHTAERVDIAAELGYQNAESNERIEDAAANVASDLADSMRRADALPPDSHYGAAADAASRSGSTDQVPTEDP